MGHLAFALVRLRYRRRGNKDLLSHIRRYRFRFIKARHYRLGRYIKEYEQTEGTDALKLVIIGEVARTAPLGGPIKQRNHRNILIIGIARSRKCSETMIMVNVSHSLS